MRICRKPTFPWKGRAAAKGRGGVNGGRTGPAGSLASHMLQRRGFRVTRAMNRRVDRFEDALHVRGEIIVPEADHAVAFSRPFGATMRGQGDIETYLVVGARWISRISSTGQSGTWSPEHRAIVFAKSRSSFARSAIFPRMLRR